jgi:hypothetical protein
VQTFDLDDYPFLSHICFSIDLVTRILYRLRFQTERKALDAGSYAFISPLLSNAISSGGLGINTDETERALEQLALAVDIIGFHVREGESALLCYNFSLVLWQLNKNRLASDTAYPRQQMIADLLGALNGYPSLRKPAASALADLGNAIGDSSTKAEIAALLEGTLVDEVFVRQACLQAVQVSALSRGLQA